MTQSSELNLASTRSRRLRFGMRTLLALPIVAGLGVFAADRLAARFLSARRQIGVQIQAVDDETNRSITNGTLMLYREDENHPALYMGDSANFTLYDCGIYNYMTSWVSGRRWTDYRGWSVSIRAKGYQDWESTLPKLTADESRFQNTIHPPAITVRLKKKPRG